MSDVLPCYPHQLDDQLMRRLSTARATGQPATWPYVLALICCMMRGPRIQQEQQELRYLGFMEASHSTGV
jgi:hypothetical protein